MSREARWPSGTKQTALNAKTAVRKPYTVSTWLTVRAGLMPSDIRSATGVWSATATA